MHEGQPRRNSTMKRRPRQAARKAGGRSCPPSPPPASLTHADVLARLAALRSQAKERAMAVAIETMAGNGSTPEEIGAFRAWFEPEVEKTLDRQFGNLNRIVESIRATLEMPSAEVH